MPAQRGGIDPETGIEYVDQDTPDGVKRRYLAALPTPDDHRMKMGASWSEVTGIAPAPRSAWPALVFDHTRSRVPIVDQTRHNSCVGYTGGSTAMLLRDRAGLPFVHLSSGFIYTLINGGRDAGANAGDLVDALVKYGICPLSVVPGDPIRPAGVSQAALDAAAAYKLRDDGRVPIASFDEAVTAALFGWEVLFDVQAGPSYNTDDKGRVRYLGGRTNHEQHAGEGLVFIDGKPYLKGRNSWGQSWGMKGFGYYGESHFEASNTTIACKFMRDASIPDMPVLV